MIHQQLIVRIDGRGPIQICKWKRKGRCTGTGHSKRQRNGAAVGRWGSHYKKRHTTCLPHWTRSADRLSSAVVHRAKMSVLHPKLSGVQSISTTSLATAPTQHWPTMAWAKVKAGRGYRRGGNSTCEARNPLLCTQGKDAGGITKDTC